MSAFGGDVGTGGAQSGAGFAAGPSTGSGSLTSGMSTADLNALQAAGVSLAGPETGLSGAEAALMQPQSMGGTGAGGSERAFAASQAQPKQQQQNKGQAYAQASAGHKKGDSQPSPIYDINSIMASMFPTGIPQMADGGELPPGGTALVGEQGPELLQAGDMGGATVTPLRAAQPQKPSRGRQAAHILGEALMGLGGPTGAQAIASRRAAVAEQRSKLATAALQNPVLLRSSPSAVAAVDGMFGQGTSDQLVRSGDPNVQARAMAQLWGVPLLTPGTQREDGSVVGSETSQLQDVLGAFGYGMSTTSKGEVRITKPPRSAEQQDEITARGYYTQLQKAFRAQGLKEEVADVAAAKRYVDIAGARGLTVPKFINDLAMADTKQKLDVARAAATQFTKEQIGLQFAGPKAAAGERARRAERINDPISADEVQVRGGKIAEAMGGVAYGRDMTEDDLMAADEQKFVLKQQADGSYIGIPKDKVTDDAMVLYPSEMLTKKLARKMAAKQTTQQQNARIVIEGLNQIDELDALALLPEAAPQGATLGSQLAGAVQTELAGQTTGRATVWSARRSPDAAVREKAIALINLKSLATSVVKALGDVGAISEADKSIIYERLSRLANGTASRQEAATQVQQLRQMMIASQAAGNVTKDSDAANQLKEDISNIVSGQGGTSVHTPPRGYQVAPGTGAFYSVTP